MTVRLLERTQTHSTFKAGSETHAPMIDRFVQAVICLRVSVTDRYLPLSVLRESLEKQFTLRDIPFKTRTLNMRLGQNNAADLCEVLPASVHLQISHLRSIQRWSQTLSSAGITGWRYRGISVWRAAEEDWA